MNVILWLIACGAFAGSILLLIILHNRSEQIYLLKALIGDLRASLDKANRDLLLKPEKKDVPSKVATYTLMTPAAWRSSTDRVNWMRSLLGQRYFLDVLSMLQSTTINPPSHGFDSAYELGRVHGLQLAVKTMLMLSTLEQAASSEPLADYGALDMAERSGVKIDPKAAETALTGEWQELSPEENAEPLT